MLSDKLNGLLPSILSLSGEVATIKGRLAGVSGSHEAPALSGQLTEAADPSASESIKTPFYGLVVSAYQNGVGKDENIHRTAYPSDIQNHIVNKIKVMDSPGEYTGGVFALVACNTEGELSARMDVLADLFPIPDLVAVAQRVKHLTTLETDSRTPIEQTYSGHMAVQPANGGSVLQFADSFVSEGIAQAQCYTEQAADPVSELSALLDEKKAYLDSLVNPLPDVPETTVSYHSLNATSRSDLANQIKGLSLGFENSPYSVGVVLLASDDTLAYLKELVGL